MRPWNLFTMPTCAVMTCKKSSAKVNYSKDGISFHFFPQDPKIKEKWIDATGRGSNWFPHKYSTICSTHFKKEMFLPINKCRRLFEWAVPKINVCHIISDLEESSASSSHLKRKHTSLDGTDEEKTMKQKIEESCNILDENSETSSEIDEETSLTDENDMNMRIFMKEDLNPQEEEVKIEISETNNDEDLTVFSLSSIDNATMSNTSGMMRTDNSTMSNTTGIMRTDNSTMSNTPRVMHEFNKFGASIAAQLKNMPLPDALEAQMFIQNYLSNLRLETLRRQNQ